MTAYEELCARLSGGEPHRWLVTGCAGFIGSALVEALLRLGQEVVGLDNFATGHRTNLDDVAATLGAEAAARLRFIEGDICDLDTCFEAAAGVRYVLHQAAIGSVPRSIDDPIESHRANVDGFVNMLVAARDAGAERFVYASSSSVYGDDERLPKVEEAIGRPLSPYAVTKRVDELYARVFQDSYALESIGLRYFNVFGPRQDPEGPYAAVIPKWLDALFAGQRCVVFGDGKTSRDFCFVANAVQANLLAAASAGSAATGRVYNVGCGDTTTLEQLFEHLRGAAAEHRAAAAAAELAYEPERPGDVRHSQADVSAIAASMGYVPSHDIGAGIRETVAWFADRAS